MGQGVVRLEVKIFICVGPFLMVNRGGEGAIRVVLDKSVKKGELTILFLLYCELDGEEERSCLSGKYLE